MRRALLAAIISLPATGCLAGLVLEKVSGRYEGGTPVVSRLLIDAPAARAPRAVLLVVPEGNGLGGIGGPEFGRPRSPFVRLRPSLAAYGVATAWLDPPSDLPQGLRWAGREDPSHFRDIRAAARFLRERFRGTRILLAGYADSARSITGYLLWDPSEIDGAIIAGGYFADLREKRFESVARRGLLLHSVTQACGPAPHIEAREFARKARFELVEFAQPAWESRFDCSSASQNALVGHDADIARTIDQWLEGKELPARVGDPQVAPIWKESVHLIPFEGGRLEISVFAPRGEGPFPLLVFNHGDIDADSTYVRRSSRYRELIIAQEFVHLGFAVAQPARPGVGMSSGTYRLVRLGGDPTEKARMHAASISAALDYLRSLPFLDMDRVVLAGQSAGGWAVTEMAGMDRRGLRGVINFSGGRSDTPQGQPAMSGINRWMVDGFAAMGARARVPVLFVFAENDSRYHKDTIGASFEAFTVAGGNGRLVLRPPLKGDGHFVYHHPDLWRMEAQQFLAALGFKAPGTEAPKPSADPRLAQVQAVPRISEKGKDLYEQFLATKRRPRAFAISLQGASYWTTGPDAVEKAKAGCETFGSMCFLYAVDDSVVWKDTISVDQGICDPSKVDPRLCDVDAVPVRPEGKERYKAFLTILERPRAFVVSEGGGWRFLSGQNASQRALDLCSKTASKCQVYAEDDRVVWSPGGR